MLHDDDARMQRGPVRLQHGQTPLSLTWLYAWELGWRSWCGVASCGGLDTILVVGLLEQTP